MCVCVISVDSAIYLDFWGGRGRGWCPLCALHTTSIPIARSFARCSKVVPSVMMLNHIINYLFFIRITSRCDNIHYHIHAVSFLFVDSLSSTKIYPLDTDLTTSHVTMLPFHTHDLGV